MADLNRNCKSYLYILISTKRHDEAAVELLWDNFTIFVLYNGTCKGGKLYPCNNCARIVRMSKDSTIPGNQRSCVCCTSIAQPYITLLYKIDRGCGTPESIQNISVAAVFAVKGICRKCASYVDTMQDKCKWFVRLCFIYDIIKEQSKHGDT